MNFTKINSAPVSSTTYTDSTVADGESYQYYVTGLNAAGIESSPSSTVTVTIPASGTHSVTLSWAGDPSDAGGYNVYRFLVPVPAVPTNLAAVVN